MTNNDADRTVSISDRVNSMEWNRPERVLAGRSFVSREPHDDMIVDYG